MMQCRKCGDWKDPGEFSRHAVAKGKPPKYCKLCMSKREKRYRIKHFQKYADTLRAYRKRPEVHESRMDYQRLYRWRKRRLARKDGTSQ
jgi:hypothetical protein